MKEIYHLDGNPNNHNLDNVKIVRGPNWKCSDTFSGWVSELNKTQELQIYEKGSTFELWLVTYILNIVSEKLIATFSDLKAAKAHARVWVGDSE